MMEQFAKIIAACAMACVIAGPTIAGSLELGCYERDYSSTHLKKYPSQIVDRIVLRIFEQQGAGKFANMWVTTAHQGHVAASGHGGQQFNQFLLCWSDNGVNGCSVECDGGGMQIIKQSGKSLTFRTKSLWVGNTDECGGSVNLAEVQNQPVSYRLNRVSDAVCAAEN